MKKKIKIFFTAYLTFFFKKKEENEMLRGSNCFTPKMCPETHTLFLIAVVKLCYIELKSLFSVRKETLGLNNIL